MKFLVGQVVVNEVELPDGATIGDALTALGLNGEVPAGSSVWTALGADLEANQEIEPNDLAVVVVSGLPITEPVDEDEDKDDVDGANPGADDAGGDNDGAGGGTEEDTKG